MEAELSFFYDLLDISTVVTIVVGMCMNHPERSLSCYLLAFGQIIFIAGAFALDFFKNVLHIETPIPSMFDAFWSSGYPILTTGLVLLILGFSDERMRCVLHVISDHRNPLERSWRRG